MKKEGEIPKGKDKKKDRGEVPIINGRGMDAKIGPRKLLLIG